MVWIALCCNGKCRWVYLWLTACLCLSNMINAMCPFHQIKVKCSFNFITAKLTCKLYIPILHELSILGAKSNKELQSNQICFLNFERRVVKYAHKPLMKKMECNRF